MQIQSRNTTGHGESTGNGNSEDHSRNHSKNLVALLESRVEEWGERPFFRFLVEGELDGIQEELSFAALAGAARAIAARLTSEAARERPVLILVPPGPHFLKAFFGCLYAGAIAVPMYPPDPARLQRSIERLQAIVNHCRSGLLLTTKEWSPMLAGAVHASGLRMVTLDAV
ncbi:MAG TPA: AMP-binding protein, partial [Polyangiaceae bacterium]|nr:AMP-binding protein [Polyangiaceae bacterium]